MSVDVSPHKLAGPSSVQGCIYKVNRRQARVGALGYSSVSRKLMWADFRAPWCVKHFQQVWKYTVFGLIHGTQ